MNFTKKDFFRVIFLFIGIFGVVFYRGLPDGWYVLMWIPINLGYSVWYGDYFFKK